MTEAEVEKVVLDSVRRYTRDEAASPQARFREDLRMSDVARQMLFASLAQAFDARGVSLPSHGFWQKDFLACPTPAAAEAAIRAKIFRAGGSHKKSSSTPASATTTTTSTGSAASEATTAVQPVQPAGEATSTVTAESAAPSAPAKPAKRGRAAKKPAKKKSAPKKSREKTPPPAGGTVETDWGV